MKRNILIFTLLIFAAGCAHCSLTETKFKGKTKGMNPYGDGDITIDRTSYWGTQECLNTLFGDYKPEDPIEIDISDMDPGLFADDI